MKWESWTAGECDRQITCAEPGGMNYAEREYFRFHAAIRSRGPFIGSRIKSKVDGTYNFTVMRRISHADGSFRRRCGH